MQFIPQCKLCVDSDWRFGKEPSSNLTSDHHVSGNERPLANSFLKHPLLRLLNTSLLLGVPAKRTLVSQAFEMEKYNVESYQKPSVRFRRASDPASFPTAIGREMRSLYLRTRLGVGRDPRRPFCGQTRGEEARPTASHPAAKGVPLSKKRNSFKSYTVSYHS